MQVNAEPTRRQLIEERDEYKRRAQHMEELATAARALADKAITDVRAILATLPTAWAVIAPGEHPKAKDTWDDETQALSYAGVTGLILQRVVIVPVEGKE